MAIMLLKVELFDYDKIIKTYSLGGTMTECAAKMHCSVDTVKKVLTINNIPIRHNRRGCCSDPKKVVLLKEST